MSVHEVLSKTESGLRLALAASLYRDGVMSLGKASQLGCISTSDFISHLAHLGIEIVGVDETAEHEASDLSAWLS